MPAGDVESHQKIARLSSEISELADTIKRQDHVNGENERLDDALIELADLPETDVSDVRHKFHALERYLEIRADFNAGQAPWRIFRSVGTFLQTLGLFALFSCCFTQDLM